MTAAATPAAESLATGLTALTERRVPDIVRRMVNYLETAPAERMNRVFAALSDPMRRTVLSQLEAEGPQSVSDLAGPLPIKMPTVLKHLGVLDDAGLIRREKKGRVVTVMLSPEPMAEAMAWLSRYERFWTDRLDRLGRYLEQEK